jgi:predicted nucleotidyltransferase
MDDNVPAAITTGLRIRGVDVLTALEDGHHTMPDAQLVDRAHVLGRVLFTRDDDLIAEAVQRQQQGTPFHGVIYAHQLRVSIGAAVRDLELIAKAAEPEDLSTRFSTYLCNPITMAQTQTDTGLKQLGQERDELLDRVTRVLEADTRVKVAWLSGSFGRGEADEWSDLDLHVAVVDEQLPAILEEHRALFDRCGPVLQVLRSMPSDSLPSGHFWLVQYAPYMLEVDWNIGPVGQAVRPEASHLLFDRAGVPIAPPLPPISEEQRRSDAHWQLTFFWAMAAIAIKFAGRGHTRLAVRQSDLLKDATIKLWRAVSQPELLQRDGYHQNRPLEPELSARLPRFAPGIDPLAALEVIRALCREVESLHPALAALGATVDEGVAKEVAALAEIAEIIAREGGSAPERGSRR